MTRIFLKSTFACVPVIYLKPAQVFSVKCCHNTHRLSVIAVVVVPVRIVAIEVQVVRVVTAVLRTAPIVAVRAKVVERTVVVVAVAHRGQKKPKRF